MKFPREEKEPAIKVDRRIYEWLQQYGGHGGLRQDHGPLKLSINIRLKVDLFALDSSRPYTDSGLAMVLEGWHSLSDLESKMGQSLTAIGDKVCHAYWNLDRSTGTQR
ncbi:hypothetical protein J1614_002601 [Plenodomus biglobosus]|nr:hypothetical protein J1614_002601 [Plenodomus biglobosus]